MTGSPEPTPFTWQSYQERGFGELLTLLGAGWELADVDSVEVEVLVGGQRVGNLLAIDFDEVKLQLGPHECMYVAQDTATGSCLSLSLEGNLCPDACHPIDLAAAAEVFRRAVGG